MKFKVYTGKPYAGREFTLDNIRELFSTKDYNFSYADGVNYKIVMETPISKHKEVNYLIDDSHIGYFVISTNFIAVAQNQSYIIEYTLLRDVVREHWATLLGLDCKYDRGQLTNAAPLFTYFQEDFQVNQLKQSTVDIGSNSNWLVLYYTNSADSTLTIPAYNVTEAVDYSFNEVNTLLGGDVQVLNDHTLYKDSRTTPIIDHINEHAVYFDTFWTYGFAPKNGGRIKIIFTRDSIRAEMIDEDGRNHLLVERINNINQHNQEIKERLIDEYFSQFNSLGLVETPNIQQNIQTLQSKVTQDDTSVWLSRVQIVDIENMNGQSHSRLFPYYSQEIRDMYSTDDGWYFREMFPQTSITGAKFKLTSISMKTPVITLNVPQAKPMDNVGCYCMAVEITEQSEYQIKDIISKMTMLMGDSLFDVQQVPFKPTYSGEVVKVINSDSEEIFRFNVIVKNTSYDTISVPIPIDELYNDNRLLSLVSMKICSPNHGNAYEFNPLKAGFKDVVTLYVNMTLKPNSTVVQVRLADTENSLYGSQSQSGQGCIQEAGFSLTRVSNAWVNYQLNNSTYQKSFDREIKNFEFKNNISKTKEDHNLKIQAANFATDTISSAMGQAGQVASMSTSIAQTLVSSGGGIVKGMVSMQSRKYLNSLNQDLRNENLAYRKDMFQLKLKSTQDRPNTISQLTDRSASYRWSFYIDIFYPTISEINQILKILEYNGSTLGVWGQFGDEYCKGWVACSIPEILLKRLEPQVIDQIIKELKHGWYF